MSEPAATRTPASGRPGNVREQLEQRERRILSPHAALAAESRGRARPEEEHPYRTAFQRDRDRILHTRAFRRLKRKTQVFLSTQGDHFRTRLTHTLEVSQIARDAARALFLNEDLVEAIAMGHDLGHTPFGHAGEFVLNELYAPGFNHAEQSLRIVDHLEETRHGRGLNLTSEVRDGIRNHSRGKAVLLGKPEYAAATREADLMAVCDAIAYVNHDIDDAVRGGLISLRDLPQDCIRVLGETSSERINMMVGALIEYSRDGEIGMRPDIRDAMWELRSYLYANLYPSEAVRREIDKGKKILGEIYGYLLDNPPEEALAGPDSEPVERRVVDIVAGMTDSHALDLYRKLFFPESWRD
jgi:dGTPase